MAVESGREGSAATLWLAGERVIDISLVVYRNTVEEVECLLDSIARQTVAARLKLHVRIRNNDRTLAEQWETLAARCNEAPSRVVSVSVTHSEENVGFGHAHNTNIALGDAPFVLVLNPDLELFPNALEELLAEVEPNTPVAAWEMRQTPFEHPKDYDPSLLTTSWVSGAAVLFRRDAFDAVGGFDERIFLYGEDVDLSWRLRASGYALKYVPRAVVVHRTYATGGEVKPAQIFNGIYASLCLRARFGTWRDIAAGLALSLVELSGIRKLPRGRRATLDSLWRFARSLRYFRSSGAIFRERGFRGEFLLWNYGRRRLGAFHPLATEPLAKDAWPLVSVIVRTHARADLLRYALLSIAHQTYPNIETVVVEDGAPTAKAMVEAEFSSRLAIRYEATGEPVGRSAAGNRALALARGEWLCFLDDDDQLYADHIEVLMTAAAERRANAAYGAADFVPSTVRHDAQGHLEIEEGEPYAHFRTFSQIAMWQENLVTIQSVVFKRELYERHGGFDESMDQLEDWLLWTRYALDGDFYAVRKTTSRARVPQSHAVAATRQHKLHQSYERAVEMQKSMRITMSPREVVAMVDEQARSQSLVYVSRRSARRFAAKYPVLTRVFGSQSRLSFMLRAVSRRLQQLRQK
ncbi:glycosyltransferase family 2 protein [Paraburkholderia sp. JHI869]|uniref:glycosyltransferase family 2 protein n=1 Tax=Paraburkholderia sp. JHI869 TaxID=3112959 RepID=UPI00317E89F3